METTDCLGGGPPGRVTVAAVAPAGINRTVRVAQSQIEHSQEERLAHEWGLRTEEWARYQQLMQGRWAFIRQSRPGFRARRGGAFGRGAPPLCRTQVRQKPAESKLLAYQRAYDDARQRLQPGAQRVEHARCLVRTGQQPGQQRCGWQRTNGGLCA